MTEPLGLLQTIFCTSQNQILNIIIETALHTQDQKYRTPLQTISEMQSPFNNLDWAATHPGGGGGYSHFFVDT